MVLSPLSLNITLLKCDFCGTHHPDEASAENHGCIEGEPAQIIKPGDVVTATAQLAAGMESLGRQDIKARVVALAKPHEFAWNLEKVKPSWAGGYNEGILQFQVPYLEHDWYVTLEPVEEAPKDRYFHIHPTPLQEILKLNPDLRTMA